MKDCASEKSKTKVISVSTIVSVYVLQGVFRISAVRKTQVESHSRPKLRRQNGESKGSKAARIHRTKYRLGAAERRNSEDLQRVPGEHSAED